MLAWLLVAVFAGMIAPHDPSRRFEPYSPPGSRHLLGTNDMGYDILSELIMGTRISLLVGLATAAVATLVGLAAGLAAGYSGRFLDEILTGLIDVFLMIPRIPMLILLSAFMQPGALTLSILLGLLWWPPIARIVRSATLQEKKAAFVESAVCLGFSRPRILLGEILPNIMPVVKAKFLMTFASAMIAEASISFLGLGNPLLRSWGRMLYTAFNKGGLIHGMYWWILPPGFCIAAVVVTVMATGMALEETGRSPKREVLRP